MMDMANPLAGAGVLLAIIAVLFGAWTAEVTATIELKLAAQKENRAGERKQIRSVIYSKALPLALGGWLAAGVFAWRAAKLIFGAIACGSSNNCTYDDVGAAFVLTEIFVIVVAISATKQLVQLVQKLRKSY